MSTCVWCWRREKVVQCGVTDLLAVDVDVCIVSRWIVNGLYIDVAGDRRATVHSLERKR